MSDWSQPVCDECWTERHPDRYPVRLRNADVEVCCLCGCRTTSGMYERIDPRTVPHPRVASSDTGTPEGNE